MTDCGHDLLFGSFLTPTAAQPAAVLALAQLTERVGLDLVTVQDRPYQTRFLDTWTLLSVIAGRTSTVRLVPNVACEVFPLVRWGRQVSPGPRGAPSG